MKLIYTSLIESRLRYGIVLWGSTSQTNFQRVFILQKRAVRIMAKLNGRTSCRNHFKTLKILTLASIYIYELLIFYRFKSTTFVTGATVHNYDTRHRLEHRQLSHRLELASTLPQNIGPKLFNKLPLHIRETDVLNNFKRFLYNFLVEEAFYSVNEYLEI